MTTKAQWIALAERCETAMESDRDIERCMGSLLPEGFQMIPYFGFTASIDAITALIERELPGWDWSITKAYEYCEATLWRYDPVFRSTAASPALALCAAFCSVMAANLEIET
jgi:hypothetical protein